MFVYSLFTRAFKNKVKIGFAFHSQLYSAASIGHFVSQIVTYLEGCGLYKRRDFIWCLPSLESILFPLVESYDILRLKWGVVTFSGFVSKNIVAHVF